MDLRVLGEPGAPLTTLIEYPLANSTDKAPHHPEQRLSTGLGENPHRTQGGSKFQNRVTTHEHLFSTTTFCILCPKSSTSPSFCSSVSDSPALHARPGCNLTRTHAAQHQLNEIDLAAQYTPRESSMTSHSRDSRFRI
jgi:hypothetical protein